MAALNNIISFQNIVLFFIGKHNLNVIKKETLKTVELTMIPFF